MDRLKTRASENPGASAALKLRASPFLPLPLPLSFLPRLWPSSVLPYMSGLLLENSPSSLTTQLEQVSGYCDWVIFLLHSFSKLWFEVK